MRAISMQQFWHNSITDASFAFLQELRRNFQFVLIGGWAVYFYTHALKSKDIDIVVDFAELGKLRRTFDLVKNDRLRKYEIKGESFDVDIYVPHWSELGLPLDSVMGDTVSREGFRLPKKEILLALKLFVWRERKTSLKGKKDMVDIIGLLYHNSIALTDFYEILKKNNLTDLVAELAHMLETAFELKELHLNRKQFSDFKKPLLRELKKFTNG